MARKFTSVFAVLAAVFALLLVVSAPALAGGKDDREDKKSERVKADKDDSGYTEDNDTNDGGTANNVSDDGDNAHPSGKDRSVENGGSGNQGNSTSDPDDDGRGPDRTNGGPDKPNGTGGTDKADQDGNNGCGNDDDFEDDNEGWCGNKPKKDKKSKDEVKAAKTEKPCDADHTMAGNQPCEDEEVAVDVSPAVPTDVLGLRVAQKPAVKAAKVAPAQVRGARVRGGALPFTGGDVAVFVFIALGLVGAGYLMLKARRTTS